MPQLNNPTETDLFAPQIHRIVPAYGSVEINDSEGELFADNPVFTVSREDPAQDDAQPSETSDEAGETKNIPAGGTPKRATARRGGKQAEVTEAPPMETR
ncbi:MAG TPA: hypothetical protein VFW64_12230 [Pseudonocardiaceae bacterium]|nr:hypothetical protein [Pseudonocardiaceae bacterium]